MKILDTRVYRGPNLYALRKVIRLRVDLGELEDYPTNKLPGFVDALLEAIPTLREHGCSYGDARRLRAPHDRGRGDLARARAGARRHRAPVPRRHAGHATARRAATTCRRGQYHVIYSYEEEIVGLEAAEVGLRLLLHLLPPERAAHLPGPYRLQGRARGSRPPRPAPRLRPLDRLPGARRRGAGHARGSA